jgi:glycerophosphoryl diester phosphodiesterase
MPRKFKSRFKNPIYVNAIKRNTVLHISHRGGSRENLENTIKAFDHAVKLGTDVLEMDVCFTKDNKVL